MKITFGFLLYLLIIASPAYTQDVRAVVSRDTAPLPEWMERILTQDPNAFEFRRVWRARLEQARTTRQRLAARGFKAEILSPFRSAQLGVAVSGTMSVPVFPIIYRNTESEPYPSNYLQHLLFSRTPEAESLSNLYHELSLGVFELTGVVHKWTQVARDDTAYEGSQSGLADLIEEVLDQVDRDVDFRRFDRDGDHFVDVVAFVQPEMGGECYTSNIRSLRWVYGSARGTGRAYRTNDGVFVSDFVIQPAWGCYGERIQIGVFAHELGHALGLPDLYSTTDPPINGGIGWWSLMSTGSWNQPKSPAHMDAWSKVELGWLARVTISESIENVVLEPSPPGSAVRINVPGSPGEYFLLENRQPDGFDRYLLGAGLLIWHVDSAVIAQEFESNRVQNNTLRKGIDLEEADGLDQLDQPYQVGDSSDVFPLEDRGRIHFDGSTTPNSNGNDGRPSGIAIRNIRRNGRNIIFDIIISPP